MSAPGPRETPPHDEWRALVAGMARGDQAALARLHDEAGGLIYGTCLRILGEPAAAEDAALEAFLQAWRQAATHDPSRGSVASWLVVIARSRALDARRRLRRAGAASAEPREPAPEAPGPDIAAGRSALARHVRSALARLPKEQAEALVAAFYDGMSHTEIAAALDQPLGTIKTRIRAGLARLRADLGQDMMSASS